jgi:hypothetical protein
MIDFLVPFDESIVGIKLTKELPAFRVMPISADVHNQEDIEP